MAQKYSTERREISLAESARASAPQAESCGEKRPTTAKPWSVEVLLGVFLSAA
jgi:hypothetical protein